MSFYDWISFPERGEFLVYRKDRIELNQIVDPLLHEHLWTYGGDNKREFVQWKTRHYEIRSKEQFKSKLDDRMAIYDDPLKSGGNDHYADMYNKLKNDPTFGIISTDELHYDDGISELNMEEIYDWKKHVY